MNSNKDFFAKKASTYDLEKRRVDNVKNIADKIKECIELKSDMHIADFGSGTGLLLREIAPFVKKITAIDRSESMNEMLKKNIDEIDCEVEIVPIDLSIEKPDMEFDGIISSMTMHHVRDIDRLFETFYSMLKAGGFVALADLDCEDGSFHSEDTGVCHYGFDRAFITECAKRAGFEDVQIRDASVVKKPYGEYPVFLLCGRR